MFLKYKRIAKHPIVFTALGPKVFSILEEVRQLFSLRAIYNPVSHESSAFFHTNSVIAYCLDHTGNTG